jgi:hypothetical protein
VLLVKRLLQTKLPERTLELLFELQAVEVEAVVTVDVGLELW